MYTPTHFAQTDTATLVAFMQRFSFATIVSQVDGRPFASHLPFVVDHTEAGEVVLLAHFAKANPQWKTLADQTVLVIFTEPHAYISPSLYEKELNVPTWNYVAVHAYGQVTLVTDEAQTFELLEKQMQTFEKEYLIQWSQLPQEYKNAMVKGIVAFQMEITQLEGKEKLSQNKKVQEQERIMHHLMESPDEAARQIGERMQQKAAEQNRTNL